MPSLDAEVLTVLAGTTRPLTGREIGRLVRRGSASGVQKVLNRLADHGLVSVQEAGPALLYVLNLVSDIDVFVVRPDDVDGDNVAWREQVAELAAATTRWTGNAASVIEASVEEARAMSDRAEPVVGDLMRDAVPLAGERIADVLSGRVR